MTQLITLDYDKTVKQIRENIVAGIEAWKAAGDLLVRLIDQSPENRERVKVSFKDTPPGLLKSLEAVGRRKLHPLVYAQEGTGFRRLQRMPLDLQEKHLAEPVELLVVNDGKADILKVAVKDMSREQALQAFTETEIRDIPAQRAYLASINRRPTPLRLDDVYKITKDKFLVLQPYEFTQAQLAGLLPQMFTKKQLAGLLALMG